MQNEHKLAIKTIFSINSYNGKSSWSLEDLRYHQFMTAAATSKTTIKLQTLPPMENAAQYHFLRIHLQVIEWKR